MTSDYENEFKRNSVLRCELRQRIRSTIRYLRTWKGDGFHRDEGDQKSCRSFIQSHWHLR